MHSKLSLEKGTQFIQNCNKNLFDKKPPPPLPPENFLVCPPNVKIIATPLVLGILYYVYCITVVQAGCIKNNASIKVWPRIIILLSM